MAPIVDDDISQTTTIFTSTSTMCAITKCAQNHVATEHKFDKLRRQEHIIDRIDLAEDATAVTSKYCVGTIGEEEGNERDEAVEA